MCSLKYRFVMIYFLGAAFLAAGFLAAGFLAAGFLAAFLAAGFLAAFFGFLAFLALGFFAFLTFFGLTTLTSLYDPAPLPVALAILRAPLTTPRLRARRTWTAALAASTLLLATIDLRMAWREEPVRSFRVVMAVAIITEYLGWAAGALGAFLAGAAAGADMMMFCVGYSLESPC